MPIFVNFTVQPHDENLKLVLDDPLPRYLIINCVILDEIEDQFQIEMERKQKKKRSFFSRIADFFTADLESRYIQAAKEFEYKKRGITYDYIFLENRLNVYVCAYNDYSFVKLLRIEFTLVD